MPLPTRKKGESKDNFISRCMGASTTKKEFPDRDQRFAVCQSRAFRASVDFSEREEEILGRLVDKQSKKKKEDKDKRENKGY